MALRDRKELADAGLLGYLAVLYVTVFVAYLGLRKGLLWYGGLIHPSGAMPAWAFGPAWAMLCLLLGYAAWRLYLADRCRSRTVALWLFAAQLVAHAFWAWLLFGFERPVPAVACVGAALLLTGTVVAFSLKARPGIAAVLAPYLVWLCYMTVLTYGVWSLNFRNGNGVTRIETITDSN